MGTTTSKTVNRVVVAPFHHEGKVAAMRPVTMLSMTGVILSAEETVESVMRYLDKLPRAHRMTLVPLVGEVKSHLSRLYTMVCERKSYAGNPNALQAEPRRLSNGSEDNDFCDSGSSVRTFGSGIREDSE